MRKTLSLLALVLPFVIMAQTSTKPAGTGTQFNPYQIATLDNIYWLTQTSAEWVAGKYFVQTADIDASLTRNWTSWAGANGGSSPIGNNSNFFSGSYDGGGKVISNLYMKMTNNSGVGFFGATNGAVIKNLGITNADFTLIGGGILAGYIGSTTSVSGCFTTGKLVSNNSQDGALIGYASNSSISNCYSTASVSSNGGYFGGLLGTVSGGTVSNCYSTGKVISTGTGFPYGGVIACVVNSPTIQNCFWDKETSGSVNNSGAIAGTTGKTTTEMKTINTYSSWNFSYIWTINSRQNGGYPYLSYQTLPYNNSPVVSTTSITVYDKTSATMGGNVTSDEGATVTARGVVYSTTDPTPTIAEGATNIAIASGTGAFSQSVSSLTSGTLYYVNSYAINSVGTSYGTPTSFTTIGTTTSVDANPDQTHHISFDPGNDKLNATGYEGTADITLTDISGKQMFTKTITKGESISTNALPKGLYLAKVTTKKRTTIKKFMKY